MVCWKDRVGCADSHPQTGLTPASLESPHLQAPLKKSLDLTVQTLTRDIIESLLKPAKHAGLKMALVKC